MLFVNIFEIFLVRQSILGNVPDYYESDMVGQALVFKLKNQFSEDFRSLNASL